VRWSGRGEIVDGHDALDRGRWGRWRKDGAGVDRCDRDHGSDEMRRRDGSGRWAKAGERTGGGGGGHGGDNPRAYREHEEQPGTVRFGLRLLPISGEASVGQRGNSHYGVSFNRAKAAFGLVSRGKRMTGAAYLRPSETISQRGF
jgi:hypothetical protein